MESYRFPESDWKLLRSIQDKALVKACEQVFLAVETITEKRTSREHEAYLELWDLIKEKDREIANTFNNISRNTAIHSLVNIFAYGYLSKEDLGKFTVETQEKVLFMTQDRR
jgi:hypothetical protein